MLRLLFRLIVQRAKESQTRRQALKRIRASQRSAKQPSKYKRPALFVGSAALIAAIPFFYFFVFDHSVETFDPNKAQLTVRVSSVDVAPMIVYLERQMPLLSPIPENDEVTQMIIENNQFVPTFQIVEPGSTLEILNTDDFLHNAHIMDGDDTVFNVATPLKSITVRKMIKATGMLKVQCDLHPFMHGWIFVPSNSFYAVVSEPREFSWSGITPGDYWLRIWQAGTMGPEKEVQLAALQSEVVEIL